MKRKSIIFSIFLLGIVLFNVSIVTALASDDDLDGVDDEFEELNTRDIEIEFLEDEFEVEALLRSGPVRDKIKFSVSYDSDGLSVELQYNPEFESDDQNNIELEFSISFQKLIEFVDMDDNGIYDETVDQTIQEVEIKDFKSLNYFQISIAPETNLHYFILNTTDDIFTAHIYFSEEFVKINNNIISPSQSKIDIEINNFNFLQNTSQLALYVKLESEVNYEEKEETEDEKFGFANDETSVFTSNQNRFGFLSWKETAIIDGINSSISISPIEIDDDDEFEQKLYICYQRGQKIYHDPKIGVEGILKSIPQPPFPLDLTIIIVIVIVAFSVSVAYTAYHYRAKLFPSIFLVNEKKNEFKKSMKGKPSFQNDMIGEKLLNPHLTAVSKNFFKLVNLLDMDKQEKEEFIKEMLALNPFERNLILNEMIKKAKLKEQ
ncbi:MAG: hypothetical protein ACFE9I_16640 [Candidatus Hermodarchaeota archaeon]